ncbi:similar to siderophore iron transporter mirB [Botrytis cinerea T4]|uniref:Similar to siderophore iron transporter mirB n=1 Tax=Botryotinia fuckeliana (strain T4) TaxID=999810 RepID=G2YAU4_BOTF4|nr:similar to siderophore iron transporter mirB [Botrytis cinerea T4]
MRFRFNNLTPNEVPIAEDTVHTSCVDEEKAPTTTANILLKKDSEVINKEFQHGVQAAEAINQVWTRNHLIMAYILIWIIEFLLTFASGLTGTLTPYVTSSFQAHSLTATTSIISSLIARLIKLPYAKLMDIWGRPQAFCVMVASFTLGMVMMAGCNDVKTYCAAQVFYYVGYNGIDFTLTIFIADTTQLKNRAWWIAFSSSPWIATVWAYGPAAESVLNTIGFRWGFGIWAIIFPIICIPLFGLFYYHQKKAEKQGLIQKLDSGRTWAESFIYYCREFDVIGLLLIAAGLALFLLTFSLYSYQKGEWKSPLVICFIIFGGLLIIAFALYEMYLAPVTFIPWGLMKDRTVFFTYTMVASLYCAWYIWDSYFYSMLIVVFNQSVTNATYISNIYTIGSCFWALVVGIIIRFNGRLKWLALYFGVPITILAVGLLIKFRQPDTNIGYIVMCQIFIAFGGGTLVMCEQMTVMAVSSHQHIPAVLAMEAMIASIGGAIGSTIAAALWTGIFPVKLAELLPASSQADFTSIYGSLVVQSSYPLGSDTRNAINQAYGDTQRLMLICATCLYFVTLISTMFWRNINVKDMKQIHGRIW